MIFIELIKLFFKYFVENSVAVYRIFRKKILFLFLIIFCNSRYHNICLIMERTKLNTFLFACLIILLLFNSSDLSAQRKYSKSKKQNNFQIKVMGIYGFGFNGYDIINPFPVPTATGSFSTGGGFGPELGILIVLSDYLTGDISGSYLMTSKTISEDISGIERKTRISFDRQEVRGTLKYCIPYSSERELNRTINLGAGAGYYLSGDLETKYDYGGMSLRETVEYDNSLAFHVMAEFEFQFNKTIGILGSIRYRNLSFNAVGYSNGDLTDLPSKYEIIYSSGVDFMFGILLYL